MSLSITIIIIIINVLISFVALQDERIFNSLSFWPEKVWHEKQWWRLLTGGFLHANISHLLFNMLSLFFFGPTVEYHFMLLFGAAGHMVFVAYYLLAVILANGPDLYQHKDNPYYRAVGASGAVSAVVFTSILFNPLSSIYLFLIPIGIPAYIFGVLYLIYSAYMAKRQSDNIGHLAHFSGAIFGIIFPMLFQPTLIMECIQKVLTR